MAVESFSQIYDFPKTQTEMIDPKVLQEIENMITHFRTSDQLYAIRTEVAGLRDWQGVRHIDFGWMLFYIYRTTRNKGPIDSKYLTEVMKRNPDLTQMASKYLIETILPTQITQNIPQEQKEPVQKEIQAFIGRHQELVNGLANAQDISSIIETMYDMGVFLGRFTPQVAGEVPSVNRAIISGYKLYSHPKLQNIMQTFWSEYVAGADNQSQKDMFPVIRKIIQGKSAKVISPEYQKFLTDANIQNTLIQPLQNPEKLLAFFRNTGSRIDQILEIGNSPKVSKWRIAGKWKDDREKHHALRQILLDMMNDLFEIYGPFFAQLTVFLEKNQTTWQYFLQNGMRLKDKGDITPEKSSGFGVTPDNVLRGMVGTGVTYSTNYLNSKMFMDGMIQPETLGLIFTAFLVEFFDIWGETEVKAMLGAQLRKYGINFNTNTFGIMLNTTKTKRPQIYQGLADMRDIFKFMGDLDGKKMVEIQEKWKNFFPQK